MSSFLKSLMPGSGQRGGGFMPTTISPSTIAIVLFVVVLISIGIYYYFKMVSPKLKPSYKANNEILYNGDNNNQAEIILFYVDWCPHCKTAKPEWDNFKNQVQGTTINGHVVVCTEINCTNETPEIESMVKQYKIEGYPTIKLVKDGQIIDFEAKPTQTTLTQFVNTAI